MKKSLIGKILLISIFILVLSLLLLINLSYTNENQKPVYLEDIKVSTMVINYNKNVKESKLEYLVNEEKILKEDDSYWYGLYEDIVFHIIPLRYTGELDEDIVLESSIFYDKNSKNEELANKYIFNLIKTNVPELTKEEIDEIIRKTKEIGKDNINLKSGKGYASNGLIVTYWINEDNYHFCLEREREVLDEKNN